MNQQGGIMSLMFPIVMFVGIFYFLIIRPQKKKQKAHDEMIASIGRGSTVITAGGFFGVVTDIKDDSYILEIAENTKVRIVKSSISMKYEGDEEKPERERKPRRRRPKDGERRPRRGEGKPEKAEVKELKAEDAAKEDVAKGEPPAAKAEAKPAEPEKAATPEAKPKDEA